MKKVLLAAAAVAAALMASPAVAANLETQQIIPFPNYVPNVGGTFENTDPTAFVSPAFLNFNNVFNFATNFERNAFVDITSMMTTGIPSTNVNFISNGVRLTGTLIPVVSRGVNEQRTLINFRLPAGAQQILVQGSAGTRGEYAGILTLSGVPEPTTWAMMILGLGFAGAAMRRRRQTTRVTYA